MENEITLFEEEIIDEDDNYYSIDEEQEELRYCKPTINIFSHIYKIGR